MVRASELVAIVCYCAVLHVESLKLHICEGSQLDFASESVGV